MEDYNAVLAKALQLLARREHSVVELRNKLLQRFNELSFINSAIEYCLENNYLSDVRYAEHFVLVKSKYGWGPFYLQKKLEDFQIDSVIIDQVLSVINFDQWVMYGLLWIKKHDLIDSKYGFNNKQTQKLMRRGFEFAMIQKIQSVWLNELESAEEYSNGN